MENRPEMDMAETWDRLEVADVEFWHEIMCSHVLEASCTELDPDFRFSLAFSRHTDFQISRVKSVRHTWERSKKHLRHSSRDDLVVYLQLRGTSVQVQDGKEICLREGEWTCTDTTRPMSLRLQGDFEQLLVHIPRSVLLPAIGPTERFTSMHLGESNPLGHVVTSFLQSVGGVLDRVSPSVAATLEETAVSLIMTSFAERASIRLDHPSWPKKALHFRAQEFAQRHSRNPNLTPTRLAAELNISLRYLQEIFAETGTSPSDFIWECRLRHAERDLRNPVLAGLNVSDIALRCGFSDTAHFSRRFKERTGLSPRAFRLQAGMIASSIISSGSREV